MKTLFAIAAAIVVSACAHTPREQPLRVVGSGSTYEEAKAMAFRDAIELKVGTMVLSERENVNYRQTRNDILVYSAGFVDDYKVVSKVENNNRYYVTMDVTVSSTKLSDRLLNPNGNVQVFDSARHVAQTNTIIESREQATKMLREVINEYPKRAYVLQQRPYTLQVDQNNKTIISVGYRLSFDYEWLKSANAALLKFSDGTSQLNSFFNGALRPSSAEAIIISKNPNALLVGEKSHYTFSNVKNFEVFRAAFYDDNEVRVRMVFRGKANNIIYNSCWAPMFLSGRGNTGSFYGSSDLYKFVIWGNSYEDSTIKVSVPQDMLRNISHIELSMTNTKEC